jgi:hypothetical protein
MMPARHVALTLGVKICSTGDVVVSSSSLITTLINSITCKKY